MSKLWMALLLASASTMLPAGATAETVALVPAIAGTRLDLSVPGEVSRVPDVATVSAGVVTQAASAAEALAQNGARMERVRGALRRAGIAERDIQTASIALAPQYRYPANEQPVLTGYQASNQLSVRFRDMRGAGRIIDALVGEGANQINGPSLSIDKPEAALDEARDQAVATGRARAERYARALGLHVVRVISVSEAGGYAPPPMPMQMMARVKSADAASAIDPGEQQLQVTVTMSFELR